MGRFSAFVGRIRRSGRIAVAVAAGGALTAGVGEASRLAHASDPPASGNYTVPTADSLLSKMQEEGSWSIVMMDQPGRTITFTFGDLGKQIVDLKWAQDQGASLGEVRQRLDKVYEEETGGFGDSKTDAKSKSGKQASAVEAEGGADKSVAARQAYAEIRKTVEALNRRRYGDARSRIAWLEAAVQRLPETERADYSDAVKALKKAHALLSSEETLGNMVRAAQRGDFERRETLKKELKACGREIPLDLEPFEAVVAEIWDAYKTPGPPAAGVRDATLAGVLQELKAAEKLVQGRFLRRDYLAAMERVRGGAKGLPKKDRKVVAGRLKAHADMWNKAAARTLSFALYARIQGKIPGGHEPLLEQARWKGKQAARADNLAKELMQ